MYKIIQYLEINMFFGGWGLFSFYNSDQLLQNLLEWIMVFKFW